MLLSHIRLYINKNYKGRPLGLLDHDWKICSQKEIKIIKLYNMYMYISHKIQYIQISKHHMVFLQFWINSGFTILLKRHSIMVKNNFHKSSFHFFLLHIWNMSFILYYRFKTCLLLYDYLICNNYFIYSCNKLYVI